MMLHWETFTPLYNERRGGKKRWNRGREGEKGDERWWWRRAEDNQYVNHWNEQCIKDDSLYLSSRSSLSWCPCGSVSNSNPEDTPIILCVSEVTPNILATCNQELNNNLLHVHNVMCPTGVHTCAFTLCDCACVCLHMCVCVCARTCAYRAVHHGDVFSRGPCIHLSQQLFDSLQHRHLQRLILSGHKARLVPVRERLQRVGKYWTGTWAQARTARKEECCKDR